MQPQHTQGLASRAPKWWRAWIAMVDERAEAIALMQKSLGFMVAYASAEPSAQGVLRVAFLDAHAHELHTACVPHPAVLASRSGAGRRGQVQQRCKRQWHGGDICASEVMGG